MRRRLAHLLAAMVVILCGSAAPAFASPAADIVQAEQAALFTLLARAHHDAAIDAWLDARLDHQAMAEASLGASWADRTDLERAQFLIAFRDLLHATQTRYLHHALDYDLRHRGERLDARDTVVTIEARSKAEPSSDPIEIAFVMAPKGETWTVQDIVVEGVSLMASHRSQFAKIIRREGFPALLERMKAKVATLRERAAEAQEAEPITPADDDAETRVEAPRASKAPSTAGWAWRLFAAFGALLVGGTVAAFWMLRAPAWRP